MRQLKRTQNVGTNFLLTMIILAVTLNACHPDFLQVGPFRSTLALTYITKWAVGAKPYLHGTFQRMPSPRFSMLKQQRPDGRFFSESEQREGTISRLQRSCEVSLNYHYNGVKIHFCSVALSSHLKQSKVASVVPK